MRTEKKDSIAGWLRTLGFSPQELLSSLETSLSDDLCLSIEDRLILDLIGRVPDQILINRVLTYDLVFAARETFQPVQLNPRQPNHSREKKIFRTTKIQ